MYNGKLRVLKKVVDAINLSEIYVIIVKLSFSYKCVHYYFYILR